MRMNQSKTQSGTDFYLQASEHYPLLQAFQEQSTDRRKWAAIRRILRVLLDAPQGREMAVEFLTACAEEPFAIDYFASRAVYFSLRKNISPLLPKGKFALDRDLLLQALREDRPTVELLRLTASIPRSATLVLGLAGMTLHASKKEFPDAISTALEEWLGAYRSSSPLSAKSLKMLRQSITRYQQQRDKLVMHNLRLVHKMAWKYRESRVSHSDLVQEGIAGLIRAAEKYEYMRGFRFTTYAYNWITQTLQRASENRGSLIIIPSNVHAEINKLHKARLDLRELSGLEPATSQLATMTGYSGDKINKLRQLTNITISTDSSPDADEREVGIQVPDPNSTRGIELAHNSSLKKLLGGCMDGLEERERCVVAARWGLDGQPTLTFAQLAEKMDVSQEWARQLERSALRKLAQSPDLNEAFKLLA